MDGPSNQVCFFLITSLTRQAPPLHLISVRYEMQEECVVVGHGQLATAYPDACIAISREAHVVAVGTAHIEFFDAQQGLPLYTVHNPHLGVLKQFPSSTTFAVYPKRQRNNKYRSMFA